MKRQEQKTKEMYDLYAQGFSLFEIANKYKITRQSVYARFKRKGMKLRTLVKSNEYQIFNGKKYTKRNNGYYALTTGKRNLMHRDVWEYYNGIIPDKCDIHHIDEDKKNNDISNLECLSKSEHTKLYSPHNNQYTIGRKIKKIL